MSVGKEKPHPYVWNEVLLDNEILQSLVTIFGESNVWFYIQSVTSQVLAIFTWQKGRIKNIPKTNNNNRKWTSGKTGCECGHVPPAFYVTTESFPVRALFFFFMRKSISVNVASLRRFLTQERIASLVSISKPTCAVLCHVEMHLGWITSSASQRAQQKWLLPNFIDV